MIQSEQDQIIVHSTINLAHKLGLSVVAEGIENDEIMRALQDMSCQQAQGFHIARPMPEDALLEWFSFKHLGTRAGLYRLSPTLHIIKSFG